jgi:hypothetical protein
LKYSGLDAPVEKRWLALRTPVPEKGDLVFAIRRISRPVQNGNRGF